MAQLPDTSVVFISILFEVIHATYCFGDCCLDSICVVDDGLYPRIHAWHTGSYSPSRMKITHPKLNWRAASLSIALILAFGDLTPTDTHSLPSPAVMYLDFYDEAEAREQDRIATALARCTLGVQNHVRTAH